MAVTPVRVESPATSVAWPTRTPATSVMALCRPGLKMPGATPSSRARARRSGVGGAAWLWVTAGRAARSVRASRARAWVRGMAGRCARGHDVGRGRRPMPSPTPRTPRARRVASDPYVEPRVGTAGWSLPRAEQPHFPAEGTHLERYAARLNAVEINSSFYRPHRPSTYARWAASVPDGFRFAVKVPRTLTHERRLADPAPLLDPFLGEAGALGDRLGPLLVQLPPSLRWDADAATAFFDALRERFDGAVACEPRHPTWFAPEPEAMLARQRVARVAADPPRAGVDGEPGGWSGLRYHRLHGSPRMYYSSYDDR